MQTQNATFAKASQAEWKYYVYELIDPRTDEVFYVGKGSGDRIDQHERETADGVSSKKCNKIRKIQNEGFLIGKRKIAFFKDEKSAYEFEDERIRLYGKPNLTNIAPLMNPEDEAKVNVFLSDAWMRVVAIAVRAKAGLSLDFAGRPFSAALHKGIKGRADAMIDTSIREVGFDALRGGFRRYGVALEHGR